MNKRATVRSNRNFYKSAPPYGSVPSRVENLKGLAPAYILCGGLDLFLEENLLYASRLMAAGVPTGLKIFPGGIHGFMNAVKTQISQDYFEERRKLINQFFGALR